MRFRILYEDEHVVAIDKPAGVHVHPPEDDRHRIGYHQNAMARLRDQLGLLVYPIHRLDRATSGVLLFGKSSEAASRFAPLFQEAKVSKTYVALVRGVPKEPLGTIDSPLKTDSGSGALLEARTDYEWVMSAEWPANAGTDASRTHPYRMSLLVVRPRTGRMHQIRRHLRRLGHPLIGDTVHGEGVMNRFMRELTGDWMLYLKALELRLPHPFSGVELRIRSRFGAEWLTLFDRLGVCPTGAEVPSYRSFP